MMIKDLLKKVSDFIALVKMLMELKAALEELKASSKDAVLALAADIDGVVAKYQATPSTTDDKLIPILKAVSDALKKAVA